MEKTEKRGVFVEMLTLRHPYPTIQKDSCTAWGGNQGWLRDDASQRCGCGLVAAADLLLYLHRWGKDRNTRFFREAPGPEQGPIPADIYDYYVQRLRKRYFPILPPFGLNAFLLAAGMNRFFRREGLPFHARWGVSGSRFWGTIRSMLSRDLPVILCIGINFPLPWGKAQLSLYTRTGEDYRRTTAVRAHYVTITGLDDQWMRIASWGQEYYILRADYERYRREHSCGLYSNILAL